MIDKKLKLKADKDYYRALQDLEEINRWSEDDDVLKLKNEMGWTIAHAQAKRGWTTKNIDILKLATVHGYTVAHAQAFRGYHFSDSNPIGEEILKWKTKLTWLPSGKQLKMQPVTVKQMRDL
tara:strand:+ start:1864 stop:2229 length:366 start_codon:yes stop_codon:yes gene_type:complete